MKSVAVGLLGRGISASESPMIHEREARALGIPLTYRLADFDGLALPNTALGKTLDFLAGLDFDGVNVTHPFKQSVLEFLDEIEKTAADIGAVNCVHFANGRKIGFNSDWIGFSWMLNREFPDVSYDRVVQLGAGGAGSATAYALLVKGVKSLVVCDPDRQAASNLIERMSGCFPDADIEAAGSLESVIRSADGIVNASQVGMHKHPGMPFDPELLEADQWLADIIYFPRETALVNAARAKGLRAEGGTAMVIGQAAEPFYRFTGIEPDRDRMMRDFQNNSSDTNAQADAV